MKQIFFALILSLSFSVISCNKSGTTEAQTGEAKDTTQSNAQSNAGSVVNVDLQSSQIVWKGSKPTGSHHGTITPTSGEFKVEGNKIVGGSFQFDMNSINVKDLTDQNDKAKLEGHLKSEDFFDVQKYPTATFTITKVSEKTDGANTHLVEGNLKMRDSEKGITFPAKMNISGDGKSIQSDAKFKIDRTLWGVMYKSAKNPKLSDIEKKAKDKLISDDIEIELKLLTQK